MTLNETSKRYGVIGNPIAQSRSPFIHEAFARQTGIDLSYERILAPLDGFAEHVRHFFAEGGSGMNVTVPFKEQAFDLAHANLSPRARMAGAVNTLWTQDGVLHGCNTDGLGLLNDLIRLDAAPEGKHVLLVGAGGAARGVVFPLLDARCASLRIVNRTEKRAMELREHVVQLMPEYDARLSCGDLAAAGGPWDIVINATSSSLGDSAPDLPTDLYSAGALAYDMVYGKEPTAFMLEAKKSGAARVADGAGMLVGQAAASFALWHGVTPEIEPVLNELRLQLLQP